MKKALILSMVIVFSFSYASLAFASFKRPFGGKIMSTNTPPNVVCITNESSPFTIKPVAGPPSSWAVGPGLVNIGRIASQAWIIGLYTNSECIEYDGPEAHPYSVYYSNFYGTNKMMGI